ncbi:MAG TPA: PTS glucose transporter subunit IIA [Actinomycetales bacterium]|nr:PTS glucose transporter subunit IIA [Actinomycetales bacterium]
MTAVSSPVAGAVLPLSAVPDPVFAAEMVGSGVAIDPLRPAPSERSLALAPIAGRLMKAFPHAYVLQGEALDVLVHLGIDTVGLKGEGFTLLAEEGAEVECGTPVVEWSPGEVEARGLSPLVLVCVLGTPPGAVDPGPEGRRVAAGDALFALPQL